MSFARLGREERDGLRRGWLVARDIAEGLAGGAMNGGTRAGGAAGSAGGVELPSCMQQFRQGGAAIGGFAFQVARVPIADARGGAGRIAGGFVEGGERRDGGRQRSEIAVIDRGDVTRPCGVAVAEQ